MNRLLTPSEAADVLQVCQKTLQQCRSLGLRYVQITRGAIRYKPEDLQEFIEARTIQECRSEKRARKTGTMTSNSKVVDFMGLAKPTTSKTRN
ncbi:helix-turn-helix domain-containing protein [uncultured Tateyamaria sp.]|uniref:helix-turn-helix domain-containing protein n=1 Tax=Tateyamaria sp. 1078 TaxID=3417464 RepID=UPI00344A60D4